MTNIRYGSGKNRFVGRGIDVDLTTLDPGAYEGAVVYADGQLYFSNGSAWLIPQDEVDITRPRGLTPTNANEQTQLRVTPFSSPTGETQTAVIFEINADGVPDFTEEGNVITRRIDDAVTNIYDVLYPDDGFQPGDTIWWRARYLGTNGTQSEFSFPIAQTYPPLIETPEPVTRVNQIVGQVQVTEFTSPSVFGLNYFETQTEIYNEAGDTLLYSETHVNGSITVLPDAATLPEGEFYSFRTRYGGRVNLGSPVVYSEWSDLRVFFAGGGSMLLEYNLDQATNRTVYLPLGVHDATGLNVEVDWGDGSALETFTTGGVKSHVYAAGVGPIVNVRISGTMRQYGSWEVNSNLNAGLKRVDSWGQKLGLTSLRGALSNATATLEFVDGNLPTTVTNVQYMFARSIGFNGDLSGLDTSSITDMSFMFFTTAANSTFSNDSLRDWNTSNVTNMQYMFAGNRLGDQQNNFNGDISNWDVSKVTTFYRMFNNNGAFNNDSLNTWVTGVPCTMNGMFLTASVFNGNIDGMDTSNVTDMGSMFQNAYAFNKPLNSWNVSNVTNMANMFENAGAFNQPLNNWNVSSVTNMAAMFSGQDRSTMTFDQNIGAWDVSNVTTMVRMFGCSSRVGHGTNNNHSILFNNGGSPDINNWNTISVTDMNNMFAGCRFNQPIGNWNVSNVTNMSYMFSSGRYSSFNNTFNQDIGAWDVSNVTTMRAMFGAYHAAHGFNNGGSPSIDNWNTSKVTDMTAMFNASWEGSGRPGYHSFNQPIGSWDVSSVTSMAVMFLQQSVDPITGVRHPFNQPIGNWDVGSVASFDNMFYLGPFNQDISAWDLRNTGGVDLDPFLVSLNTTLYSKLLVGWANTTYAQNAPTGITLGLSGVTYDGTIDFSADFPGGRFTNATDARAFLIGNRSVVVSGASNASADGTYNYNAATLTYDNAVSGWYFIRIGNTWELRDDLDVVQDSSSGNQSDPWFETGWTSVLLNATLESGGAFWTISGDASV